MKRIILISVSLLFFFVCPGIVLADIQDSLIVFYPFNGNADDYSSNNLNGVVNGAILTEDRFGNPNSAYSFDGEDDYIDLGNDNRLKPYFPLSVSMWIKVDTLKASPIFTNNFDIDIYNGIWVMVKPSGELEASYGNGGRCNPEGRKTINSNPVVNTGEWLHVVAIYHDYSTIDLYVNSQKMSCVTSGFASFLNYSAGPAYIGQKDGSDNLPPIFFRGNMDDVRFYYQALDSAEVDSLYHITRYDFPRHDLIGYFPMDGNANDQSTYGNNGSIVGNVQPTTDRFEEDGSALSFDGTDSYLDIEHSASLDTLNGLTVSMWSRNRQLTSGFYQLFSKFSPDQSSVGWGAGIDGENQTVEFLVSLDSSTTDTIKSARKLAPEEWNHVVIRLFGTTVKIDINGQSDTTVILPKKPSNLTNNNKLLIGKMRDVQTYLGDLDDIRLYNYALDNTHVRALFTEKDWGTPYIISISDVSDDQGNWVYVKWRAHFSDRAGKIVQYGIWELNPNDEWVSVGNVPALQDTEYIFLAHTFQNSTKWFERVSNFKITAHTTVPETYYTSSVGSGSSVDNIFPYVPKYVVASISGEDNSVFLNWQESTDEDFAYYRIYRNELSGSKILIAQQTVAAFHDMTVTLGKTYYYRVSAVDINENESNTSSAAVAAILDTEKNPSAPTEFKLHNNYPNPFNASTMIAYDIPKEAFVKIEVFNMSGQIVETLVNKKQAAGYYTFTFDGKGLSSGVYFYKLTAGEFSWINKCVLLK
ncbi:MAG: LamG-like jellyroll fold domain-containing protein [Methanoregula sp.]